MGRNQPMQYSSPQESFVQIPLHVEHSPISTINQTCDSNQRRNKWLTIIISIFFVVTGQSIVRLLENYYFLHRDRSSGYGAWTQALLHVVGFPILIIPFLLLLLLNKQKQLLIISSGISLRQLVMMFPIICIYMSIHALFVNIKHRIPFKVFTLIYTTQLFFTLLFSSCLNKIKLNIWMIISLAFSIIAGTFTLYTFSAGSPNDDNWKKSNHWRIYAAFMAALFFSTLLCMIRTAFEEFISMCKTKRKQPSFIVVLELLIFSSLLATAFLLAAVFVSGEHNNLKSQMDGFSKGQTAYLMTIVGQVVAWQIYWVGIVGLVFAVSAVFSNVISVCTWPIVSLLVAFLYSKYDQFDVFRGIALGAAALSVASYIYNIHKEKSDGDEATT